MIRLHRAPQALIVNTLPMGTRGSKLERDSNA
jgi:hypothetical protein